MKKEPYAGADFYKKKKKLVSVAIYLPRIVRAAYKKKAVTLKKRHPKMKVSAQKLMVRVLVRNKPR